MKSWIVLPLHFSSVRNELAILCYWPSKSGCVFNGKHNIRCTLCVAGIRSRSVSRFVFLQFSSQAPDLGNVFCHQGQMVSQICETCKRPKSNVRIVRHIISIGPSTWLADRKKSTKSSQLLTPNTCRSSLEFPEHSSKQKKDAQSILAPWFCVCQLPALDQTLPESLIKSSNTCWSSTGPAPGTVCSCLWRLCSLFMRTTLWQQKWKSRWLCLAQQSGPCHWIGPVPAKNIHKQVWTGHSYMHYELAESTRLMSAVSTAHVHVGRACGSWPIRRSTAEPKRWKQQLHLD